MGSFLGGVSFSYFGLCCGLVWLRYWFSTVLLLFSFEFVVILLRCRYGFAMVWTWFGYMG